MRRADHSEARRSLPPTPRAAYRQGEGRACAPSRSSPEKFITLAAIYVAGLTVAIMLDGVITALLAGG